MYFSYLSDHTPNKQKQDISRKLSKICSKMNLNTIDSRFPTTYSSQLIIGLKGMAAKL